MQVDVVRHRSLRFDDGAPVRAASAVVPWRGGRLVVQDDATSAAWVRASAVARVRVLPAVDGHDVFDEEAGTKHLKPDLEAAVALDDGRALLLGSGSTGTRTRLVLLTPDGPVVRALPELYEQVALALDSPPGTLNLEGACLLDGRLRWFRRGAAGLASASVDLDLEALLAAVHGARPQVALSSPLTYDLGDVDGVALAVTDAVALPDGRVLVSLAAEDTPNPVDDGPVVASGLALLDGERVVAQAHLPHGEDGVHKVEGLALLEAGDGSGAVVVAVVDDDDARSASTELVLRVRF